MSTTKKETVKKAPASKATKRTAAPVAKSAEAAGPVVTSNKEVAPVGLHRRKEAVGVVVSNKMQKTIVVKTDRRIRHGLYQKYQTKSQKFKAHDEKNEAQVGDLVSIVESRPLSREKRWALQKIIRRAVQTVEANV